MAFYINGVQVAEPAKEGLTITDEPIWASNTGRGTNGKMIGDIVAWKTTVEVTWPPLSFTDAQTIRDAIKNAGNFFAIRYPDFSAGTLVTKTVYCGNIPRTTHSLVSQLKNGVTITFIEQ